MSELKGRSGKKPKYQIADIGGADLTSQDISTERVLNFLIKGELGSAAQGGSVSDTDIVEAEDAISLPQSPPDKPPESLAPPESSAPIATGSVEPLQKKSLAHLFERASNSGAAKDAKLDSTKQDQLSIPSPPSASPALLSDPAEASLSVVTYDDEAPANITGASSEPRQTVVRKAGATPRQVERSAPRQVSKNTTASLSSVDAGAELAHHIDLWKNFYRLKAGEIEALSTMFRLSYEHRRTECFVKMRELAEMSSLTYRYCQKVVRTLERLGWITKLKDYDSTNHLGVLYRVNRKPTRTVS